jgi:hypothetical protein
LPEIFFAKANKKGGLVPPFFVLVAALPNATYHRDVMLSPFDGTQDNSANHGFPRPREKQILSPAASE